MWSQIATTYLQDWRSQIVTSSLHSMACAVPFFNPSNHFPREAPKRQNPMSRPREDGVLLLFYRGRRVSSSSITARQSRCQIRSTRLRVTASAGQAKSEARKKSQSPKFKWPKQAETKEAIPLAGPKTVELLTQMSRKRLEKQRSKIRALVAFGAARGG
jgi:hypothetical protein